MRATLVFFRLLCKEVKSITLASFQKRFFNTRYHMLQPNSLKKPCHHWWALVNQEAKARRKVEAEVMNKEQGTSNVYGVSHGDTPAIISQKPKSDIPDNGYLSWGLPILSATIGEPDNPATKYQGISCRP
jgi:hypothetical protein